MLAADVPPTPVVAGDVPDPSVVRAADAYYGVSTSNSWAPVFRIIRSPDLNRWKVVGAVFPRAPDWAVDDFWAPDVSALGGGYALVYSARKRGARGRLYCTGIAFAARPGGPWRDLGKPLRCGPYGSIDGELVRDEAGHLNLVFKEDGNAFREPAIIYAQQLSEDGRALIGPQRELFRNTVAWEDKVVEAPTIVRRPDAFYMLYSGNLCCTPGCAYAVGVARSPTLIGPWEKYEGNPILRDGNGWRCPGHTTLVGDDVLFHAFRTGAGAQLTGRQLLRDRLTWGADGWPRIGTGTPQPPTRSRRAAPFKDRLTRRIPDWEFPVRNIPRVTTGVAGARLFAPRALGARLDAGVLARQLSGDRYVATVKVRTGELRGKERGGIASYSDNFESIHAIGVAAARDGSLVVWQRRGARYKVLRRRKVVRRAETWLRITARGDDFRFAASADGRRWTAVGGRLHGPLSESARLVLTAGGVRGGSARFRALAVTGG